MTPSVAKKSATKQSSKRAAGRAVTKLTPQSKASMSPPKKRARFGHALSIEALSGLTGELQSIRLYPPVTKRADGKYEGDILGFVRGLRLSARVLYFLREHLSSTGLEVSWGHLLSNNLESCSPECDIIVHERGCVRRWNGFENPVMSFAFVKASTARLVVSCKSILTSIDTDYPKTLQDHGVTQVFLFAECCPASRFENLRKKAIQAGYSGLWCLYTTGDNDESYLRTDDQMLIDFGEKAIKAASKRIPKRQKEARKS